jgi:hypothetical protein
VHGLSGPTAAVRSGRVETAEMFFIVAGVVILLAGGGVALAMLATSPADDLGTVSADWVIQHRLDSPLASVRRHTVAFRHEPADDNAA